MQHGFEPPPLFVVFPHSTQPIGSKRWKTWQSYLTSMGKIHYIQIPEHVSSPLHWVTPTECVHSIIAEAYSKIEEVRTCVCMCVCITIITLRLNIWVHKCMFASNPICMLFT